MCELYDTVFEWIVVVLPDKDFSLCATDERSLVRKGGFESNKSANKLCLPAYLS